MDDILDILWFKVVAVVQYLSDFMDYILTPLTPLGPALIILILVTFTIVFTKKFSSMYTTKRYRELKKDFTHWQKLREEAMAVEDYKKGKAMAKNIDSAHLNKAYYDYFFEGFLNNILTNYLPVLIMAAYVNEAFKSARLMKNYGREYIFKFNTPGGETILVGALLWFVLSFLLVHLVWIIVRSQFKKFIKKKNPES
ncbi:MAG: hypothetical protein B6I22_11715 [Desulfobacteraceae bacterium 4572_123]|nr:MAG: hypothetical protein B6I22_11715 [Desulfobacteraceae bacterium 4572_123]